MGNRAVIAFDEYNPQGMGLYLHWNGGRDSVEAFLEATRQVMGDRLGDQQYGRARLAQVIGTFMRGNLSFGMGLQKELDCDNFDNGVYIVDTAKMEIIGREFHRGEEQQEYDTQEMAASILEQIKASVEAGEA